MSNAEIIVQVGAEGGDLTLYGARNSNGWLFSMNVYDCTPLLLDEDEGGAAIQDRSSPVTSWTDAIAAFDRYPWAKLYPLAVHPAFRKKIWKEVQKRLNYDGDERDNINRWRRLCSDDWLDSYYDALEFFYWEPQHMVPKTQSAAELQTLAKIAKRSTKVDTVRKHLREMEVTLHHNLRQFFLLAPDALRNSPFETLFGRPFNRPLVLCGRETDIEFPIEGCMQPDFLFTADGEVVSIELKVKAKCSIDQVLKYALLGLAVELKEQTPKEHYLVLLGKGPLVTLFSSRFESIEKLTDAVRKANLSLFLNNKPHHLKQQQERLSQIVNKMQLKFLAYNDLAQMVGGAAPSQIDQSPGAEVYRNLVSGLIDEFRRRQLM